MVMMFPVEHARAREFRASFFYLKVAVKLHSSEINICSNITRPADWPDVVITDEF